MARKNIETFHTFIKQEGDAGATRGKIPVAMARAMGAEDGDIIEWEVVNGDCTGGRVLSKSERKSVERERARPSRAKATAPSKAKPKKAVKSKRRVEDDEDERPSRPSKKKGKKPVKPSRRATKVSYESQPRRPKKGKVKPKFKLSKPKR